MGTQPHARRTTTMADEAATTTFATADAWLQRTYMVAEPTHECRNLMAIIQVDPKLQDIYGCLVNPQLKNCFACPSSIGLPNTTTRAPVELCCRPAASISAGIPNAFRIVTV